MVKPKEDFPPLAPPPPSARRQTRFRRVGDLLSEVVPFEHSRRDALGVYVRVRETTQGDVAIEIDEEKLAALLRRAFVAPSGIVRDGILRLRVNRKQVLHVEPIAADDLTIDATNHG